jgi:hypothetical protein
LIIKDSGNLSFIEKIDAYRSLIVGAISRKALEKMSFSGDSSAFGALEASAKRLVAALLRVAAEKVGIDADEETFRVRRNFQNSQTIRVYIDDLDRGWSASKDDINSISALINAARDLTNEDSRIQIRIGLRSDAYYLYRTSDESTDKIEGNVVRLTWSRHDIITIMALRVAHYFNRSFDIDEFSGRSQSEIARELHQILEERKRHIDAGTIKSWQLI